MNAPVINPSVPATTRYAGTFLSKVRAPASSLSWNGQPLDQALRAQGSDTVVSSPTDNEVRAAFRQYVDHHFVDQRVFPFGDPGTSAKRAQVASHLRRIGVDQVAAAYSGGRTMVYSHDAFSQSVGISFDPEDEYLGGNVGGDLGPLPQTQADNGGIFLLHEYELNIYDGDFGYGKILNTFSLLPGERTEISIRTFQHSETSREQAASIIDNYSSEKASEFQSELQQENTSSTQFGWGAQAYARISGRDSWGFGSVEGAAGVSGEVKSQREQFARNTMRVTGNHAAKASAAREVNINTTARSQETTEQEQQIIRVLENVNLSRTLNFTFSQMNRQFNILLRLADVRVAFLDNFPERSRIVPLEQLSALLQDVVIETDQNSKADNMALVWNDVWLALNQFQDFAGNTIHIDPQGPQTGFITVSPPATTPSPAPLSTVLKVSQAYTSEYTPPNVPPASEPIKVPGIITSADQQVMRTDGIVVDAFVGAGNALDPYNTGLQTQELAEKQFENDRRELANSIAKGGTAEQAEVYRTVFYGPQASLNMELAVDEKTGSLAKSLAGAAKASSSSESEG